MARRAATPRATPRKRLPRASMAAVASVISEVVVRWRSVKISNASETAALAGGISAVSSVPFYHTAFLFSIEASAKARRQSSTSSI